MKIKRIKIENLKSIESFEFTCNENINVFLGLNGAGKSTILQAISYCLSWYIARIKSTKSNGNIIGDKDIRLGASEAILSIEINNDISWTLIKQKKYSKLKTSNKSNFTELTSYIESLLIDGMPKFLPVIAFYGVNRVVSEIPSRFKSKHELDVFSTYNDSLSAGANFRSFFEWFKEREDLENERYRNDSSFEKDNQLEAVRKAIITILPQYKDIRIQRNPREIIVTKDDKKFNIEQLSDGEKCYITLIGDIARRLAIANPLSDNPLSGEGIILIDEIELHLHPSWQTEVVSKLRSTFPNCQFFITTHSPLVVSEIRNFDDEKLIALQNGKEITSTKKPYGKTVESILNYYFNLNTVRNNEVQEKFDLLDSLLFENNYKSEKYDQAINWLKEHIGNNDKDIVVYQLEKEKRLQNEENK